MTARAPVPLKDRLTPLLQTLERLEDELASADGLDADEVESVRRLVTEVRSELGTQLIEEELKHQKLQQSIQQASERGP